MSSLKDFLEKVASGNTNYGRATKRLAQKIEAVCDIDTVIEMSLDELSDVLIAVNPTNARAISSCLNVLRKYAEFIGNQKFIECSKGIDTTEVWNKYTSSVERKRRYLSHSEFQAMLFNIEDMMNVDYYVTLMQAIYEGIYSDDLSALSNMRGQNIYGNIVVVRCEGKEPLYLWHHAQGKRTAQIKRYDIGTDICV